MCYTYNSGGKNMKILLKVIAVIMFISGILLITMSLNKNLLIVNVTEVSVNSENLDLKYGETKQISATVLPTNATDKTLTWSSSNTNLVNVDQNGNVTIKSNQNGSAVITVKSKNGKSDTITINVQKVNTNVAVTSVSIKETSMTLKYGESKKISATISPTNATDKTLTWSSSNTNLVNVDQNGNVTIKSNQKGSAVITVKSKNGKSDTITINVQKVVDLIVFMGQSNMAGYGGNASEAPVVPKGHGYWFKSFSDPTKLYEITEPFGKGEGDSKSPLGRSQRNGSLVSAFANAYYENTGIPIVAVFAAQGATSIENWKPTGGFLRDAINRYKTAKVWLEENGYYIRNDFMVWCQGESDGVNYTSKNVYKTKFGAIIDAMKKQGIDKCFVVRVGVQKNNATLYDQIIGAQTELCKERKDTIMASTATAGFAKEGLMSDIYHYTQKGYNKVGTLAGENAAYYVNTGIEPSMYDVRYEKKYNPYDNDNKVIKTNYKSNTNISLDGSYKSQGNGRIAITEYFQSSTIPIVEIDCYEQYVNAVKNAGGSNAAFPVIAFRYYDKNKNFIGTTSNGNHAYVRIVLCIMNSNKKTDLELSNGTVILPDNVAENWILTVNGVKYLLTNK